MVQKKANHLRLATNQRRRILSADDSGVVTPSSVVVEASPRVVLYAPDGTPLTRMIGFAPLGSDRTTRGTHGH